MINLQIGAGQNRMPPPWVNCDLYPGSAVDVVFDLEKPWPFADSSVHYIYGSHVLEHLHASEVLFQQAWRVSEDMGTLLLRTPYGAHRAAWWDVTHQRPWFAESFAHLQPGYHEAIFNPQHAASQAFPWQVDYAQMRVSGELRNWFRWRWQRRLVMPYIPYLTDVVEELFVQLRALKTPESVQRFVEQGWYPSSIPAQYVMYQHEFEGRALRHGEALTFKTLGLGQITAGYLCRREKEHGDN